MPGLSRGLGDCIPVSEHEVETSFHQDRIGRLHLLNAVDAGTDLHRDPPIGLDLYRPEIGQNVGHQLPVSDAPRRWQLPGARAVRARRAGGREQLMEKRHQTPLRIGMREDHRPIILLSGRKVLDIRR